MPTKLYMIMCENMDMAIRKKCRKYEQETKSLDNEETQGKRKNNKKKKHTQKSKDKKQRKHMPGSEGLQNSLRRTKAAAFKAASTLTPAVPKSAEMTGINKSN